MTAIDWATKPAPWCWIGVAFAAEVHAICGRETAPLPETLPDLLGVQLRGRMISAKMPVAVLAQQAGCSRQMIGSLLAGTSTASPSLWQRIDEALASAAEKLGRR